MGPSGPPYLQTRDAINKGTNIAANLGVLHLGAPATTQRVVRLPAMVERWTPQAPLHGFAQSNILLLHLIAGSQVLSDSLLIDGQHTLIQEVVKENAAGGR